MHFLCAFGYMDYDFVISEKLGLWKGGGGGGFCLMHRSNHLFKKSRSTYLLHCTSILKVTVAVMMIDHRLEK
jgi:hypothetical protein